jgi:hypothetical protein
MLAALGPRQLRCAGRAGFWRGTARQLPGQVREGRQQAVGVRFGERRSYGRPVGEGNGLIVAAEGHVDHKAEDASLGSESQIR